MSGTGVAFPFFDSNLVALPRSRASSSSDPESGSDSAYFLLADAVAMVIVVERVGVRCVRAWVWAWVGVLDGEAWGEARSWRFSGEGREGVCEGAADEREAWEWVELGVSVGVGLDGVRVGVDGG